MKLLLIRHGDPDYEKDSLTSTGWKEAKELADRLDRISIDAAYQSPLGRAQDTASIWKRRNNREIPVKDWLREFHAPVIFPQGEHIPWDQLPTVWTQQEAYFDRHLWYQTSLMQSGPVESEYNRVIRGLDEVLAAHGYERKGEMYQVTKPNTDTIVFFCHLGVSCVLLSHLLNVSPVVLWQGCYLAPTSVTTLITEEREKGCAVFRMQAMGDISHLTAAGMEPSFMGRFCECYDDFSQRH